MKKALIVIMATVSVGMMGMKGEGGREEKGDGGGRGGEVRSEIDYDADGLPDWWEKKWVVPADMGQQFETGGYRYGDMVGWWQLDDGSGNMCEDRSVNQKGLEVSSDKGWKVQGQEFGKGYVMIEKGGWLSVLPIVGGTYDNGGEWTYSVWVKTSVTGESQTVAQWRDVKGLGWELGIKGSGVAYGKFERGGVGILGSTAIVVSNKKSGKVVGDGEWHHLVLVYDGEEGKLYVDGEIEDRKVVGGNIGSQCVQFKMGAAGWDGGDYEGGIDEMRLYRKALEGSEMNLLPNWAGDPDGDGLNNGGEYEAGSDPLNPDSDGDGLMDGEDSMPMDAAGDYDGDGLSDVEEVAQGLDPENADSDGDGLGDGWEVEHGFNPLDATDGNADADGDGISNGQEVSSGSDMWDYYNGELPEVEIVSGDHQDGNAGKMLGASVVIRISKNGVSQVNAPVRVSLTGINQGELWSGAVGGSGELSEVRTDAGGKVSIEWKLGAKEFEINQGVVKVKSAGVSKEVNIDAYGVAQEVPLGGLVRWWKAGEPWVVKDGNGGVSQWKGVLKSNASASQADVNKRPKYEEGGEESNEQWNGKGVVKWDGASWLEYNAVELSSHTIVVVHRLNGYAKDGVGPLVNAKLGGGWESYGVELGYRHVTPANTSEWVYEEGMIGAVAQESVYNSGGSLGEVKETVKGFLVPLEVSLQVWTRDSVGEVNFREEGEEREVNSGVIGNGGGINGSRGWIGKAREAMEGGIGEVMIWDRALSPQEMAGVEKYLKRWHGFEDKDGDGLKAKDEFAQGTSDEEVDSNGDGVWDGVSFQFACGVGANGELLMKELDPSSNDVDGDGLTNAQEYAIGSNAFCPDSDEDGILDGADETPLGVENLGNGIADLLSIKKPSGAVILP